MAKTTVPDTISLLRLLSNSITVTLLHQNMEGKRPLLPQRPPSFNPEAATFSPTKGNAGLWSSAGDYGPTPPMSPQKVAVTPATAKDASPFRTAPELRPVYEAVDEGSRAQPDTSYTPLDLHDLIRALEQAQLEAAKANVFPPMDSIDTAMPYLPKDVFSSQHHEPSFSTPEVDELSLTLGLPGVASKDKTGDEIPVCPHDVSNPEDSTDGYLFDKLMEQALDKPLTANALARYMRSPKASKATEAVDLTPSHHLDMPLEQMNGEDAATKLVQPPPGFFGETPRMIHAEKSQTASSVIQDPQPIPISFGNARRFSDLQPPNSLQHHNPQYRGPGNRRNTRPRAPTRTKRSDQGPEPSAADIYPDDAVYMPPGGPSSSIRRTSSSTTRRPSFAVPDAHLTSLPEYTFIPPPRLSAQHTIIEDLTSWPTPAEVYAGKAPPSPVQQTPPPPVEVPAAVAPIVVFDVFADHCSPSEADIHATDAQVDALIDFAPYLFALELSDAMMRDDRPLTPGQVDGSRYGLRFHGIGLGDCWKGVAPGGGIVL
ncbi:hypothetical protein yc1106_05407 [Curvularia clavata]|uniref:Uncharacterized protein n=1 Tax=Curvularia clavata TaxID=95742 RepID=A0A9Q8ZC99_CURCL|nr:hypothetical protein yc1106_05407 [Curvularia clavata]